MELQNKIGDTNNQAVTSSVKLPETKFCTWCGEMATGYNSVGQETCGIPGNHPGCDDEIVRPIE